MNLSGQLALQVKDDAAGQQVQQLRCVCPGTPYQHASLGVLYERSVLIQSSGGTRREMLAAVQTELAESRADLARLSTERHHIERVANKLETSVLAAEKVTMQVRNPPRVLYFGAKGWRGIAFSLRHANQTHLLASSLTDLAPPATTEQEKYAVEKQRRENGKTLPLSCVCFHCSGRG